MLICLMTPRRYFCWLIEAVRNGADIAIGSRYVNGGQNVGWAWQRKVLSQCANWLVRFLLLRLPIHDATNGFRVFRQGALERLNLGGIRVEGYAFQFVSTALAICEGLNVVEVPITFHERKFSKETRQTVESVASKNAPRN